MPPFGTGLSLWTTVFDPSRFAKYEPLLHDQFPDYYYSRTSNPYRTTGNSLGEVYSAIYLSALDREYSLQPLRRLQAQVRDQDALQAMLYIDSKTWLPDDLLIKADKMTMANSIELRVPLLDHKVLEFAASLPPGMKLHGATTKYILKKALSKRIPKEIRDRKKTGFPVPYGSWMRNELKDMVWDVLLDRQDDQSRVFPAGRGGRPAAKKLERYGLLQGDFFSAQPGALASNLPGKPMCRRRALHGKPVSIAL